MCQAPIGGNMYSGNVVQIYLGSVFLFACRGHLKNGHAGRDLSTGVCGSLVQAFLPFGIVQQI